VSLYEDKQEVWTDTINHTNDDLKGYESVHDEFGFRKDLVVSLLKTKGVDPARLDAVVGRGGLFPPVESGGYTGNEAMKEKILHGGINEHASNLGALIADAITAPLGIPALIYDSVASDEMIDVARITGMPEIVRQPYSHVLNTKAMARKCAQSMGKSYADMDFLVVHIGGGVSVSVHQKGRIIDCIEDDGGPFSIERAGVIPLTYIVNMAYSGQYTKRELMKKIKGMGGVQAHLGTHDMREVERRIADGDKHALRIYEALAYQIAKGVGELSIVLNGKFDAIILTGGAAHSKMLTGWITERVKFIAPVHVLPGENEMEALSLGALRIVNGEEKAKVYTGPVAPAGG
jgi:butyrate kinase